MPQHKSAERFESRRLRLESVPSALEQARSAAALLVGQKKPYNAVPWFWSDQYDLSLQIAGSPGDGVTTVRRQIGEHAFVMFHLDATGRLVAASGIGPGNSIARDVKLAEMLIAKQASPSAGVLADPSIQLKTLLKG